MLLLLYPTLTVPFCTWIMIGYFASIPKELDEAALIDGANWIADPDQDLHSGRAARHHRGDHLRLHRVLGAVPLSARLHHLGRASSCCPVGIVTTLIKGDVFNWGRS